MPRDRATGSDHGGQVSDVLARPACRRPLAGPPILVTGVPRSGTTWLARLLATADRVALAGREPMNPRGKQYALVHTLDGWTRLQRPIGRQRWALRTAYRGLNPWLYSRYGRRQWAAPLPWTRLVVKDPFAMLSLPVVASVTGARVVLLYRHPGAVLASYRRMGWRPDLDELRPLVDQARDSGLPVAGLPAGTDAGSPEAMGWFWGALHAIALHDLAAVPDAIVLSHEEVATGGPRVLARLFETLSLSATAATGKEYAKESAAPATVRAGQLHNFDRSPTDVANAWRSTLLPGELEAVEAATTTVRDRLEQQRLRLTAG
jgi:sulfotransferase family protein